MFVKACEIQAIRTLVRILSQSQLVQSSSTTYCTVVTLCKPKRGLVGFMLRNDSDLISLPSETFKLVTLYILEKQIIYIAWSLHVEWSARFKHPDYDNWKDNQYKNSLYKAYIELDRDSKQELMPLYFSPNMETEESVYISEEQYSKKMRDASFLDFSELVGKDGLTINELKQEYILNHEYHYLLPLWTRTLASDEFATPSQIELMNANPDLRNANPKLRK